MSRAAVACWLVLIATQATKAADVSITACQTQKPMKTHEYYSWREIEGRRCYYIGRPGKPKHELHWGASTKPQPLQLAERSGVKTPVVEETSEPKPSIVMMRLHPGDMLEWHWRGLWQVWTDDRLMREWRMP